MGRVRLAGVSWRRCWWSAESFQRSPQKGGHLISLVLAQPLESQCQPFAETEEVSLLNHFYHNQHTHNWRCTIEQGKFPYIDNSCVALHSIAYVAFVTSSLLGVFWSSVFRATTLLTSCDCWYFELLSPVSTNIHICEKCGTGWIPPILTIWNLTLMMLVGESLGQCDTV